MFCHLFKTTQNRVVLIGIILSFAIINTVHAKPVITPVPKAALDTLPGKYNVMWRTPGPVSAQSMPLGNGDIGLNVWVEKNGDLVFISVKLMHGEPNTRPKRTRG